MAAFAVRAKLAAVNVRVAIRTRLAHLAKNKIRMALRARDLLMHPAKRIGRVVVVELGVGSDRLPTRIGVAILARHSQRPVRIGHLRARTGCCRLRRSWCRLLWSYPAKRR